MKYEPKPHILKSLQAVKQSLIKFYCEAIDNSFDADARNIWIDQDSTSICFRDDGRGITKDCEAAIFCLGEHQGTDTTALGRYGVGITQHAINAGNKLDVASKSKDGRMTHAVRWDVMIARDTWNDDENPSWVPLSPSQRFGTTITVTSLLHKPPTQMNLDKSLNRLAQIYYPALAMGKNIHFNGKRIAKLAEPEMRDIVDTTLAFSGDKSAHVRGGMLCDPTSQLNQVHVAYRWRVITPDSTFGCDGYYGTRAMFVRIDLTGSWGLSAFKDDIIDDDCDALESAVTAVLMPLLEQCHNASMSAAVDEMTHLVNNLLPDETVPARPIKRGTTTGKSTKAEKPSQRGKSEDATETPTGPARTPRPPRNTVMIEFVDHFDAEFGMGRFIAGRHGRAGRIQLAIDNPQVCAMMALRDRYVAAAQLFMTAMFLFEHHRETTHTGGQNEFQFDGPFGLRVSGLVRMQQPRTAVAA
jgi:hypothetical protein